MSVSYVFCFDCFCFCWMLLCKGCDKFCIVFCFCFFIFIFIRCQLQKEELKYIKEKVAVIVNQIQVMEIIKVDGEEMLDTTADPDKDTNIICNYLYRRCN